MITIVADTHAILWFMSGDARLSASAKAALTLPPGHLIGVSAISLIGSSGPPRSRSVCRS